MIFLPNKFERYTAALRNSVFKLSLKNGIKAKYLKMLKKIYEAEAIVDSNNESPIMLKTYLNLLFLNAHIKLLEKDIHLKFNINVNNNYLFNRKLLTCFLLNLCAVSEKIEISESNSKIIIYCNAKDRINPNLTKALNALCFYEIKTKKQIIILKKEKTEKKPLHYIEKEWDISNPFSPVNIFLS